MIEESVPPIDVSRETRADLQVFQELVLKWTKRINIVSKDSISNLWNRHIWDSAQLAAYGTDKQLWADLGSGGGFPGIVIAILAKEQGQNRRTILMESDRRKCAFLREAIRILRLNAEVIAGRIEAVPSQQAGIVTARALTDLARLLAHAERHLAPGGAALFLKGATWEKEVEAARESWRFDLEVHKSLTNPDAAILEVKDIARA